MSDYRYLLDLVPPEELPGLLELFWDAANGTAKAPALHVYKRYPVYVEMENEIRRRLTAPIPSLTTPGKLPTDYSRPEQRSMADYNRPQERDKPK